MPKGRKYNAAEIHFKNKETKLITELNIVKEQLSGDYSKIQALEEKVTELDDENRQQKELIHILLLHTKLDLNDIWKVCVTEKRIGELIKISQLVEIFMRGGY